MERQRHSSAVEAGQKLTGLAAAQLQLQHQTALLQEKVRVMEEELKLHKRSNCRLVQELHDTFQQSEKLRMCLEVANADIRQDMETMAEQINAIQQSFATQIGGCFVQLDVLQEECDMHNLSTRDKIGALQALIVESSVFDSTQGSMQLCKNSKSGKEKQKSHAVSAACSPMPAVTDENSPSCLNTNATEDLGVGSHLYMSMHSNPSAHAYVHVWICTPHYPHMAWTVWTVFATSLKRA
eukprot:jgi/Ulvmu1/4397/UM002_0122.1